jgi:GntR family phosphonate transport system transcriptional regulator
MEKPAPLWQAIHDSLQEEISRGDWRAGARLPSEASLAQRFDVNRHTVRRALAALAEAGLVQSRRGAGVFVRGTARLPYRIGTRTRFTQNLLESGRMPSRRILQSGLARASDAEAEALALAHAAPIHVVEGISLADDVPISLFRSVFCATRFPQLGPYLEQAQSITAALQRLGVHDYTRKSTRISGQAADVLQARHLEISLGDMLLVSDSVNIDSAGKPVEYGRAHFVAARVDLVLDGAEFGPTVA